MLDEVPRPRIEVRRERVTEAARDLFARHGFHATGIAEIAEVSGIKVQQIYRDFCNKEGIVAAIVQHDVGNLFTEISQIGGSAGTSRDALRAWIHATLTRILSDEQPPLFLEVFAEASRNPRIGEILRAIDIQARDALMTVFSAFAAPDSDRLQLAAAADLLLVFIGGLSQRAVANPGLDRVRLTDMICAMLVEKISL